MWGLEYELSSMQAGAQESKVKKRPEVNLTQAAVQGKLLYQQPPQVTKG